MWLLAWKSAMPWFLVNKATMAPEAAEVCAPYQKQATGANTSLSNQIHQKINDDGANADGDDKIEEVAAKQKEAGGKVISPKGVNV
jgi:hypothetical protein